MSWKNITTVYLKELKDSLRDRRTLISVVVIPTILMPANIVGIMSSAANPHAAALFVDYNLSKEASEIMVKNQGRWTPRKDVPWTFEPQAELHVVSALEWGRKLKPLVELFRKTVGQ